MITYTFIFEERLRFKFSVNEQGDSSLEMPGERYPEWTFLENYRCEECTIPGSSRKTCPAALAIKPVVEAFDKRVSYENVLMLVERAGVKTEARVPVQRALRSLIGLLLGLSSCPVMRLLRPMALLHLPLAGMDQTAFRFLGMHFIVQYLRQQEGLSPDWDLRELLELIEEIHSVNLCLAERIRVASEEDAAINGLIILDALADAVALSIEESARKLKPLFTPYFP
jgi:hypothetical protein